MEKLEVVEDKGRLVESEKSETGGVKWSVYFMLIRMMGVPTVTFMSLFYAISYGTQSGIFTGGRSFTVFHICCCIRIRRD